MSTQQIKLTQNFLKYSDLVQKLVSKANITSNNTVVEIGAGKGIITQILASKARHVIAYEIDENLVSILYSKFKDTQNITLIHKDFLKEVRNYGEYKVFANLPFNRTSAILNKLLFSSNTPTDSFVIIQKEAALRYMGQGEGTLLSMLLRPLFTMNIEYTLSKADFDPAPSVDTVLFNIKKKPNPSIDESNMPFYRDFVCYCLNQQKPTLWLRLSKIFTKEQFTRLSNDLKFDPNIPAKNLSFDKWIGLFKYYQTGVSSEKKRLTFGACAKYLVTKDNQKKVHRTKTRL